LRQIKASGGVSCDRRGMNMPAAKHETAAPEQTPYDLIGGAAGLRKLVDRFYDLMDTDPAAAGIRAMHDRDLGPMRDKLFDFLSGWFGGPPLYFQRADAKCMGSAHAPFAIGPAERDQWMACMSTALAESDLPENMRRRVDLALFRMSDAFRTR
jgi:hemoglobin